MMSEAGRKKSNSSDSELSDSWSLVEHSDTTPTPPSTDDTARPHATLISTGSGSECSLSQSTELMGRVVSSTETETSSDAESVDIIQEESGFGDFAHHLHRHYPHRVSTITKLTTAPQTEVGGRAEGCGKQVSMPLPELWGITTTAGHHNTATTVGSTSAGLQSSEWCRLLVFTSSLVALLLLLVSYGSLFFKEQAYGRAEGMIVLPDEELSSLISDLAIMKEENSRLKKELNMIKYEYGNNMKTEKEDEEISIESATVEQVIGLEVIANEAPLDSTRIPFKILTDTLTQKTPLNADNIGQLYVEPSRVDRLRDLIHLEEQLKIFAKNIGLTNVVISSYNIAHNLDSINTIVNGLNTFIDRQASAKRDSKKFQLQQKLTKLMNRIEQDFKKSIEKVAKRVNKFHSDSLDMFCRIKGGVSDVESIDCSGFDSKSKRVDPGERFTHGERNARSGPPLRSESNAPHDPLQDRYKRSGEPPPEANHPTTPYPSLSPRRADSKPPDGRTADLKHKKNNRHFDSEKDTFKNSVDGNGADNDFDKKQENTRSTNSHGKKMKTGQPTVWKTGKNMKKNKQSGKKESRPEEGMERNVNYRHPVEDVQFITQNSEKSNNGPSLEESSERLSQDRMNSRCDRKKCVKRQGKSKSSPGGGSNSFSEYGVGSKKTSEPSKIHNESIHTRMGSGTGRRGSSKAAVSGEWYLDLGETRRQRRASRGESRSGWVFDRALVRDWCRTNSDSSLCASFGQMCDYCV